MRRWWYRRILIMFLVLTSVLSAGFGMEQIQAEAEKRQVSTSAIESQKLVPGGMTIGIYMETDGVLVLGTDFIKGRDGNSYEPAKNLIKTGDYIIGINGNEITRKKELTEVANQLETEDVVLRVRREGEEIDVRVTAVEVGQGQFKLGIWVKDNVQGLGTVTYLTSNNQFGALGHGIHDTDSDELIEISKGVSYKTSIIGITKSVRGEPGGLEGVIIYNRYNRLGTIEKNTENGIYGTLNEESVSFSQEQAMGICKKKDIEIGDATIRCTVDNEIKEYDIKIKNLDYYTGNVNKGIIIEVVDPELIELTGGIVQGMSGSPILQDGKIVGAVTHVLVNDPTRGYGIFIEDMLKQ